VRDGEVAVAVRRIEGKFVSERESWVVERR